MLNFDTRCANLPQSKWQNVSNTRWQFVCSKGVKFVAFTCCSGENWQFCVAGKFVVTDTKLVINNYKNTI